MCDKTKDGGQSAGEGLSAHKLGKHCIRERFQIATTAEAYGQSPNPNEFEQLPYINPTT